MLEVAGGILLALLAIPLAYAIFRSLPILLFVGFGLLVLIANAANGAPV